MAELCGKKRKDGQPCQRYRLTGQKVCGLHGGKTPVALRKAIVVTEVSKWVAGDQLDDPAQVLLRLITQSRRRADLYASLLEEAYAEAEKEDLIGKNVVGGVWALPAGVKALIGHKYAMDAQGNLEPVQEAIRGLVELESAERDRCANFAAKAISAGLQERIVRVQEKEAALAHAALIAGLDAAGITGDARRAVLDGVVSHLRLIEA